VLLVVIVVEHDHWGSRPSEFTPSKETSKEPLYFKDGGYRYRHNP